MKTLRRGFPFLFVALAVALLVPPLAAQPTLQGRGGDSLAAADLTRGATVVVVWASWSPHCRNIVERVNALEQRWGGQARVVTVNFQEDRAQVEEFLAGKSLSAPVYFDRDGAFAKKYPVTTLPGLIVFQAGETTFRGKLPDDPDRLLGRLFG